LRAHAPFYVRVHWLVNALLHYSLLHSPAMKWHELISALVERDGGTLAAAKKMRRPTSQGTLHRIVRGKTDSPSRAMAELISKHYKINIDALYNDAVAHAEAIRMGFIDEAGAALPAPPGVDVEDIPLERAIVITLADLASRTGGDRHVAIEAPDDLPPFISRGSDVIIDTDPGRVADGSVVAVATAGGAGVLGHYRRVVGGFEVDCGRGAVLDEARHGLRVLGVAIEMRRALGIK
jgi:hypothetical protein